MHPVPMGDAPVPYDRRRDDYTPHPASGRRSRLREMTRKVTGFVNSLNLVDVSGTPDRATIGRDETFLMTEWTDSTLTTGTKLIGPRIDYDPFPDLSDDTRRRRILPLVWYNSANPAFTGTLGGNSSRENAAADHL